MSDRASSLSQGDVEILVARELRKAGLVLSGLHVRRRTPLEEGEGRFVMLLEGMLRIDGAEAPVLVECHNRRAPVDASQARALLATAGETPGMRTIVASTSGFTSDAVALAAAEGMALLSIMDGESAWRSSAWSSGRPPAWFPEFVAHHVFAGEAGLVRSEPVQAGTSAPILARLRPRPASGATPAA